MRLAGRPGPLHSDWQHHRLSVSSGARTEAEPSRGLSITESLWRASFNIHVFTHTTAKAVAAITATSECVWMASLGRGNCAARQST